MGSVSELRSRSSASRFAMAARVVGEAEAGLVEEVTTAIVQVQAAGLGNLHYNRSIF